MSPSATPATQTEAATTAPNGNQARHQSQPSAICATPATQTEVAIRVPNENQARHQSQPSATSATPATQNEGRCHQVPRLPRKQRRPQRKTGTKRVTQPRGISATPATQNEGQCHQVPRLPRKVTVAVTKRHACHANGGGDQGAKREQSASMSQPSAKSATPATQSEGRCHQVPRLPRKVRVNVAKCHDCHTNRGDHSAKREPSASPEPAQCHK